MITAKGVVFGDGMTEIIAPPPHLEVFEVPRRKRKQVSTKDTLILASVLAPWVFGVTFMAILVTHPIAYTIYWLITYAWTGFVAYANTKTRRPRGRRTAQRTKVEPKRIIAQKWRCRKVWR